MSSPILQQLQHIINTSSIAGAPNCTLARCGMDAGCHRQPDDSWICICTHDFSLQREDGYCPRKVVTQFPRVADSHKKSYLTFSKVNDSNFIAWLDDPSTDFGEISNISSTDGSDLLLTTWLLILMGFILVASIFIILTTLIWNRKKRNNRRPVPDLISFRQLLNKHHQNQNRATVDSSNEGEENVSSVLMANTIHHEDGLILLREWIHLEEEIGQGCFGQVYRGRYRRPGASSKDPPLCDETVAIKILKNDATAGREAERQLYREALTMAEFSHPNILAVRGVVINEGKIGSWLVFEYMSLGDLAQLLRASSGVAHHIDRVNLRQNASFHLKEADLMSVAEQIASGMAYLSSQRYVHRDLACRNCLVNQLHKGSTPKGSLGVFLVKISDFGMSRDVYTTDYYRMGGSDNMLPVRWMPPESILYGKFSLESDVWSFGVVLWEIFSWGAQPYYGHSNEEVVRLILNGILLTPPKSTPPFIRQLLHGCWNSNPVHRLTFQKIDDQLISEQRQNRRSLKNQGRMYSYINPMEINSAVLHVKETAASAQLPIEARPFVSTVISVDYFQPILDSPTVESCLLSENNKAMESIV